MNEFRVVSHLRGSVSLATGSAALLVWAALAPVRPNDVALERPSVPFGRFAYRSASADTTRAELIARAAERDPFAVRATAALPTTSNPTPVVDEQPLRVLGTVVDSLGASVAICQLGTLPAVVLHVGQRLGDYELRRIDKASAWFLTPEGDRIERRVPRAGS